MNKILTFTLFVIISAANLYAQDSFILTARQSRGIVFVETPSGKWRFSTLPNGIVKTIFTPAGSDKNELISDAVIANESLESATIKKEKNQAIISWSNSDKITVSKDGVKYDLNKSTSLQLVNTHYSKEERGVSFSLNSDEKIFGLGERSIPMNRRGYKLSLYNNPWYGYSTNADALNFSVPFVLSDKHYALLLDNPAKGYVDIGKSDPAQMKYSVISGAVCFYIIPGDDYKKIMSNYSILVGSQPLPPRWAMGNFLSRFGYTDEAQAKEIHKKMKEDSVPADAIIFDLFWFGDSIKNTMGNLSWMNKKAWPDPKKMMADFKKEHIKSILITEPFFLKSSLNYDNSVKYHATDSAGNPFVLTDFYFGQGGLIDIFRKDAQQWFFGEYKKQMNNGVSGWWGDLGEPEKHPAQLYHNLKDLGFNRKFSADEVHNIYGHYWSKTLFYQFIKNYPTKRLFHLNRSGYAGSPRYSSFPWSGDVSRSWDGLKAQLPLMQGMSISGIPYIHSDAGGFAGGDRDAELYIRWLQFAAFTPIYRPHGTALGRIEPSVRDIPSESALWEEPAKSLGKEAAVTRYRWLPYNYTLCYQQSKNTKPLVTPLFFLNALDSNLYKAEDQFLWGEQVMVVPITEKGQKIKTYYIPNGNWTNVYSGKIISGPQWYTDSTISIENIPLYAAEGSFIPQSEKMMHTEEYGEKALNINYYISAKPSSYELYEDDGENPDAINSNQFELISFKSSGVKKSTTITISGNGGTYKGMYSKRKMTINIPNLPFVQSVMVNGKKLIPLTIVNKNINGISIPLEYSHKPIIINLSL